MIIYIKNNNIKNTNNNNQEIYITHLLIKSLLKNIKLNMKNVI